MKLLIHTVYSVGILYLDKVQKLEIITVILFSKICLNQVMLYDITVRLLCYQMIKTSLASWLATYHFEFKICHLWEGLVVCKTICA